MKKTPWFSLAVAVTLGSAAFDLISLPARAALIANSITEFSGIQGSNNWFNGYRNYTLSGETDNYDSKSDFIQYAGGAGQGPWDGAGQQWTGTQWDLSASGAPWAFQAAQNTHPNGANSAPNEEYWVIRRWAASELAAETPLQIIWTVRKTDTAGNGVTGGIWVNGKKLVAIAIAGNSSAGVTRTNYVTVKPADVIDLVLTPVGFDGQRTDGNDSSATSMRIDDTDADGDKLHDAWENLYSAGDLTKLNATGDLDADGLTNLAEMQLGSDPSKSDTDGDGLSDKVETNTGVFVSVNDTGTNPTNRDTDGDGRTDGDEIKVAPTSNPFLRDTDDDTFPDGLEGNSGHNPNDANEGPNTTSIGKSIDEFSGTQGENDWYYGYRNVTADRLGQKDYDPQKSFIEFTPEQFVGNQWDLNTAAAAPWDEIGPQNTHPNGNNNGAIHWTIRRWVAKEITKVTPLALHWHTRKSNLGGGNGVTGSLHINGKEVDKVTVAFNNGVGFFRTFYANLAPGDIVDLVLRPTGTDGSDADGADGSSNWLFIDPVLPTLAVQPDGTVFIPAGANDTDGDGIPDAWERVFFPTDLTKLSRDGDSDSDGLKDLAEYQRDSDPTKPDTDGDGLNDVVETNTGKFVSATDTGTNPRKTDTDGDLRGDRDEVLVTPTSDPTKLDTDGDGFSDSEEITEATNPNNKADNVLVYVIANSIAEFSGVQGSNGWFNGYRNYTLTGETVDYDPVKDFIPYVGGVGMGPWDADLQQWAGGGWDLNTAAAGPWTAQSPQNIHPNGVNSPPNEEHWATRRWVASEVSKVTPVAIIWQVRKENLSGDGVTGALYLNGKQLDSVTIAGNNGTNPVRRVYVNLNPNDFVDLALTPQGLTTRSDGADGSITWFWVDTRIPANPQQPDGTPFVPAGAGQGLKMESATFDAIQNRITLAWASAAGAKYTIEASEDLKSWTIVRADHPSGGNRTTYSEAIDAAKRSKFFRIRQ